VSASLFTCLETSWVFFCSWEYFFQKLTHQWELFFLPVGKKQTNNNNKKKKTDFLLLMRLTWMPEQQPQPRADSLPQVRQAHVIKAGFLVQKSLHCCD